MEQRYRINFKRLEELSETLDAHSIALLMVMAEFPYSPTEEEVFAKIEEYGLAEMNGEELVNWIEEWKQKRKHLLN